MYKIYVINEGDTLESIANKFSTSIDVLERINDIKDIIPGEEIIVPNNKEIPFLIYKVNKGDTLFDIARRNNVNYRDLVLINGIKDGEYIYPNQEILIPKPDVGVYTVEDPETLAQVANKTGTTMQNIIDQNASIYLLPNQLILYKKEKYL
jgi:LysM repeat protein